MNTLAKEVTGFQTNDKVLVFYLQNRYKEVLENLEIASSVHYESAIAKELEERYLLGIKHTLDGVINACLSPKAKKEVLDYVKQ